MKHINKGKEEDNFGLSIENVCYAGDECIFFLEKLINAIFSHGKIPEMLKTGLLSPIFKNKGDKKDSKNYRGISVLPIILKIIEYILRKDLRKTFDSQQSPLQRGFTPNASPMNCALLLEEFCRDSLDQNKPVYVSFLDAKSAFDVVNKEILMRKAYFSNLEPAPWVLIDGIHTDSHSSIKWGANISDQFEIHQGVKQGGLLSADLYKLYVDDLLHILEGSGVGGKIGNIVLNAAACADDVLLMSNSPYELQTLINFSLQYSKLHRYILQPVKSVILWDIKSKPPPYQWKMDDQDMPVVEKATHLGIVRGTTIEKTEKETVSQNITKARRASYSLMSSGFHGETGFDPETSLHLLRIYIQPVLLYGLELILPGQKGSDKLETYQKLLLKRLLSLPTNTPDPAVYILSGFIPVEGQIDHKALTLFNNICRQDNSSTEKQLAYRQLLLKGESSHSWFVQIRKILCRYD